MKSVWSCPLCAETLRDPRALSAHYTQERRTIDQLATTIPDSAAVASLTAGQASEPLTDGLVHSILDATGTLGTLGVIWDVHGDERRDTPLGNELEAAQTVEESGTSSSSSAVAAALAGRGAARRAQKQIQRTTQSTRSRRRDLVESLDDLEHLLRDTKKRRRERKQRLVEKTKKMSSISAAAALDLQNTENHGLVASGSLNSAFADPNDGSSGAGGAVPVCFICNRQLPDDDTLINEHITTCLNNQGSTGGPGPQSPSSANSHSNFMGSAQNDDWSVYEIAGQTRVRATSLMRQEEGASGAVSHGVKMEGSSVQDGGDMNIDIDDEVGIPLGANHAAKVEDETSDVDIDIEIDEDADEVKYGAAQFGETDLRQFYLPGQETTPIPHLDASSSTDSNPMVNSFAGMEGQSLADSAEVQPETGAIKGAGTSQLVIDSLRSRIRELERSQQAGQGQCLICMSGYTDPCVSFVCWHVHCRDCWMQSLATKRVCPQCQCITAPLDLRRIYI